MGHYIDILAARVKIADEKTIEAREAALLYLNTSDKLKYHSWLQEYLSKDQGMLTLVGILREFGWAVEEDENGDIHITGQDNDMKYSPELYDDLFAVLAPFIEDGGCVEISDSVHEMWCWSFSGGQMYRDDMKAVPLSSVRALKAAGIDVWQVMREGREPMKVGE